MAISCEGKTAWIIVLAVYSGLLTGGLIGYCALKCIKSRLSKVNKNLKGGRIEIYDYCIMMHSGLDPSKKILNISYTFGKYYAYSMAHWLQNHLLECHSGTLSVQNVGF